MFPPKENELEPPLLATLQNILEPEQPVRTCKNVQAGKVTRGVLSFTGVKREHGAP
jgi:hypothetical protein